MKKEVKILLWVITIFNNLVYCERPLFYLYPEKYKKEVVLKLGHGILNWQDGYEKSTEEEPAEGVSNICIGPDNKIYIPDVLKSRILVYEPIKEIIYSFPIAYTITKNREVDKTNLPLEIKSMGILKNGEIYIAGTDEIGNAKIFKLIPQDGFYSFVNITPEIIEKTQKLLKERNLKGRLGGGILQAPSGALFIHIWVNWEKEEGMPKFLRISAEGEFSIVSHFWENGKGQRFGRLEVVTNDKEKGGDRFYIFDEKKNQLIPTKLPLEGGTDGIDNEGYVYFGFKENWYTHYKIDPLTGKIKSVISPAEELSETSYSESLYLTGNGELYQLVVSDKGTTIYKYSPVKEENPVPKVFTSDGKYSWMNHKVLPEIFEYASRTGKGEKISEKQMREAQQLLKGLAEDYKEEIIEYGIKNENPVIKIEGARALLKVDREIGLSTLREIQKEKDVDIRLKAALVLIEEKEKEGIGYLIDLLGTKAHKEARTYLEKITQKNFGRIPPVVSKERLEEYIGRWKDWWEKNKGTFKFPEEKQQNQNQ